MQECLITALTGDSAEPQACREAPSAVRKKDTISQQWSVLPWAGNTLVVNP